MKHKLSDIVKGTALMQYFKGGSLYYTILCGSTRYLFPIDVTDLEELGEGEFRPTMEGITLMRYIKKAIEEETIRW